MIINDKTTVEEVKNNFKNVHWGLDEVNGLLLLLQTCKILKRSFKLDEKEGHIVANIVRAGKCPNQK